VVVKDAGSVRCQYTAFRYYVKSRGPAPEPDGQYTQAQLDAQSEMDKVQTEVETAYQIVLDSSRCFDPDTVAAAHKSLGK
jgi:hypothetical protein